MDTDHKGYDESLKYSIRDAKAYAVMLGAGEAFFSPLAVFLQATSLQLGVLLSVPVFLGSLLQAVSVWCTERSSSRRRIVVVSAVCGAALLLPIALLPVAAPPGEFTVWVLIVLAVCYFTAQGFALPPWSSLIGDLVPEETRGRFFAKRNKQSAIWTFLATVLAGQILALFQSWGLTSFGFLLIFLIACFARIVSADALSRHADPPYSNGKAGLLSFFSFIRQDRQSNFVRFVLLAASVHFGVAVAGPYFTPYMLKDLRLSYFLYTVIIGVGVGSQFIAMKNWGRVSDAFGSRRVLSLCGVGVSIVPLLWFFSSSLWYLVVIQVLSGVCWAGFNLAVQSFMFDSVSPQERARCVAYQAIVTAFFVLGGSLLGAYLSGVLPSIVPMFAHASHPKSSYLYLFLISGTIRILAVMIILPGLKEVREVNQGSYSEIIFRVSGVRPLFGSRFGVLALPFVRRRNN